MFSFVKKVLEYVTEILYRAAKPVDTNAAAYISILVHNIFLQNFLHLSSNLISAFFLSLVWFIFWYESCYNFIYINLI